VIKLCIVAANGESQQSVLYYKDEQKPHQHGHKFEHAPLLQSTDNSEDTFEYFNLHT